MKLIKQIEKLPQDIYSVSVGVFDGVHIAHNVIINEITKKRPSLIISFHPHPSEIIYKNKISLLTPDKEKIDILEKLGIDYLFIIEFNNKIAKIEAEDFIDWLFKYIKPKLFVIGFNHHFGYQNKGDYNLLLNLSKKYNYEVKKIDPIYVEGHIVSSSAIRNLIKEGSIEHANKLLGRYFSFSSKVISGNKIGTKLNYPTANLIYPKDKLLPKSGTYAVYIEYNNKKYKGMLSIGEMPTFNKFSVEVHIFDFNENLLNKEIKVEFVKYIRENVHFSNIEKLRQQLKKDEIYSRASL